MTTQVINHSCIEDADWDGTMQDSCKGCSIIEKTPCEYCGFGHMFVSHNPLSHVESGDPDILNVDSLSEEWYNSIHSTEVK